MTELARELTFSSRDDVKNFSCNWSAAPDEDFPGVVLLGFSAHPGDPIRETRNALTSLKIQDDTPRYNAGDINRDLKSAEVELSNSVLELLEEQHLVVVLSDGPDTIFASHRGLRAAVGLSTIVALEAQFELKSGSAPQKISQLEGKQFSYASFSFSRGTCTRGLFHTTLPPNIRVTTAAQLAQMTPEEAAATALESVSDQPFIHLSIDLRVLSLLEASGISLAHIRAVVTALAGTGRLKLIDVLNPLPHADAEEPLAQVAAQLIEDAVGAV
ncbi:formimidoylglutamase [Corynebacterium occultum]|uniref:Formimidoylglutamase n=1 Tax=Corynebacterium occultum TaxID=2675219 RepID=A0A6B8W6V1_9CORY|nr:arginase family protein [Corynebacterium occultum]QGU07045.1 formimidoylglutamase [Corynebacterium occultum]